MAGMLRYGLALPFGKPADLPEVRVALRPAQPVALLASARRRSMRLAMSRPHRRMV
jgi:hypothetical protein